MLLSTSIVQKLDLPLKLMGRFMMNLGHDEYDQDRQAYLEGLGLRVVRFRNDDVTLSPYAALDLSSRSRMRL